MAGGSCPVVRLVRATAGTSRRLTRPDGATCRLGGRSTTNGNLYPLQIYSPDPIWNTQAISNRCFGSRHPNARGELLEGLGPPGLA